MSVDVIDGIVMVGRFSIGWNFHPTRQVRRIALPAALAFADDRIMLTVGPITMIWLYGY